MDALLIFFCTFVIAFFVRKIWFLDILADKDSVQSAWGWVATGDFGMFLIVLALFCAIWGSVFGAGFLVAMWIDRTFGLGLYYQYHIYLPYIGG